MNSDQTYNALLQSGLGVIEETRTLLDLWEPGMKGSELYQVVLSSGAIRNVSATRLGDLISKCFVYRYLLKDDYPAKILKELKPVLSFNEFKQLLFLYTSRALTIFYDFIIKVYWPSYVSGRDTISTDEARNFVMQAYRDGKISGERSEYTLKRTASGLTGCCGDFGLLESGSRSVRKIIPFRIELEIVAFLAYDLHFSGLGDNSIVSHPDWGLFGLEEIDVREEFKQLSLKGFLIFQAAGDVVRISWKYNDWEEFIRVISER